MLGLSMLVLLSIALVELAQPEVLWIRDNAVKLKTVEAGHGFDDMEPLRKIIGDARIVSLGEATHGTREFFQLKHRILEFLATKMGFTIFSIEASMPVAYRLNDFVLNGAGDPVKLIKGMHVWSWNTQEVLDMVLWMRQFNRSGKGRLQFTGFDMQTPNAAARIVNDFVSDTDPAYVDAVRQAIEMAKNAYPAMPGNTSGVISGISPARGAAGERDLQAFYSGTQGLRMGRAGRANDSEAVVRIASSAWSGVIRHMETYREAYREKGAEAGYIDWAIQNARIILQYMRMQANKATRDGSMADNVKWILDNNPEAKVVLWSHNGHVSAAGLGAYDSMGASLRRMYGSEMVIFGFAFNQGSFQARNERKELRSFMVPPAPADCLESTLAAAGIPLFALDLRSAPKTGSISALLSRPRKSRIIGESYHETSASAYLLDMTALECFDALLFVEKTAAARNLE